MLEQTSVPDFIEISTTNEEIERAIESHVRFFNFWNFNDEVKIKLHESHFEDIKRFSESLIRFSASKDPNENPNEVAIKYENFVIIYYK